MNRVLLILVLAFAPMSANAYKSGDWQVDIAGETSEAYTVSDTGATFGILCAKKSASCVFYITSPTTCEQEATMPLIGNSDEGAISVTGTCTILDDAGRKVHVQVLSPFDTVELAVKMSRTIGFAMPLKDGQFRVYRFSLAGSATAITAVRQAASKASGDQTL